MTRSRPLTLGSIAALYLLWLVTWLVLKEAAFGPQHYSWSQTVAAALAAGVAWWSARHMPPPYFLFLLFLGIGFVLLAGSWVTYDPIRIRPFFHFASAEMPDFSDISQAGSLFFWVCAWGYLAISMWQQRPLSAITSVVYALVMVGLASILVPFYVAEYRPLLPTPDGRLDAAIAGLEFLTLGIGLICILLGQPLGITWILLTTTVLVACDLGYSLADVPAVLQPIWMFAQLLLVGVLLVLPNTVSSPAATRQFSPLSQESRSHQRSGLSGVLMLLSLGAVLLTVAVWLSPTPRVWKNFFSLLFVVGLVVLLVWITDRFDEAVQYLTKYTLKLHRQQLSGDDWREADGRIRPLLSATGLGSYLDFLRDSASRLKHDVLFLGPERLYPPPKPARGSGQVSCFLVMPFSLEWSSQVQQSLVGACQEHRVQAVRGDDLFTPTDILNDIWYALNNADFVVADITERNANVLYELGIAHALAKPVLILSQRATDIPIDLSTRRILLYDRIAAGWPEDLKQKVSRAIQEILTSYGMSPNERVPGERSARAIGQVNGTEATSGEGAGAYEN